MSTSSFLSFFNCCFSLPEINKKEVEVDNLCSLSNDIPVVEETIVVDLEKMKTFQSKISTEVSEVKIISQKNNKKNGITLGKIYLDDKNSENHVNKFDVNMMKSKNDPFVIKDCNELKDIKFNIIKSFEKSLDSTTLIQKSKTLNNKLLNVNYKPKEKGKVSKNKKSKRFSYLFEK